MSKASFQNHLEDLRAVSTQVYAAVHRLPMEQKARYKELANQLALLESQAAQKPGDDFQRSDEMLERAEKLLKTFQRFSSHLDTGNHAAA